MFLSDNMGVVHTVVNLSSGSDPVVQLVGVNVSCSSYAGFGSVSISCRKMAIGYIRP